MFFKHANADVWIPYGLRRVPATALAELLPCPETHRAGDIALAVVEKIGKNTRLELAAGRVATLHEGDHLAVVFGNRYATEQFEGYARSDGDRCDMLSMGGMCGLVASRHASVPEPTRLRLVGSLASAQGQRLHLRDFAVPSNPSKPSSRKPNVVLVCGSSMDAGKTYTAMSLIMGLRRTGQGVAAIKLTGTAAGRDTWSFVDAGARPSLDFVDGGYPSTYLCTTKEILALFALLLEHASEPGVEWIVVEIADGLLQRETAALMRSAPFAARLHACVFAAESSLAALCGVRMLRTWGLDPIAISGRVSMSLLGAREASSASAVDCVTAKDLQLGILNDRLVRNPVPIPTLIVGEEASTPRSEPRAHESGQRLPLAT
jgi:hypothetical protein